MFGDKSGLGRSLPKDVRGKLGGGSRIYAVRQEIDKVFCKGSVIAVFWHGNYGLRNLPPKYKNLPQIPELGKKSPVWISVSEGKETIYSHVRRFVVVEQRSGFSIAIPITSYGDGGLTKKTLSPRDISAHAIVYERDRNPKSPSLERQIPPKSTASSEADRESATKIYSWNESGRNVKGSLRQDEHCASRAQGVLSFTDFTSCRTALADALKSCGEAFLPWLSVILSSTLHSARPLLDVEVLEVARWTLSDEQFHQLELLSSFFSDTEIRGSGGILSDFRALLESKLGKVFSLDQYGAVCFNDSCMARFLESYPIPGLDVSPMILTLACLKQIEKDRLDLGAPQVLCTLSLMNLNNALNSHLAESRAKTAELTETFGFPGYAARYWAHHYRTAESLTPGLAERLGNVLWSQIGGADVNRGNRTKPYLAFEAGSTSTDYCRKLNSTWPCLAEELLAAQQDRSPCSSQESNRTSSGCEPNIYGLLQVAIAFCKQRRFPRLELAFEHMLCSSFCLEASSASSSLGIYEEPQSDSKMSEDTDWTLI